MPQISTIGAAGTYTSIPAWAAAEGSQDYGVGNPAEAILLEDMTVAGAVTGTFIRGFIIQPVAGSEFNPETLAGISITANIRPNASTAAPCIIRDINITAGIMFFNSGLYELSNGLIESPGGNAVNAQSSSVTAENIITRNCARAFEASSGNTNAIANNCTSIGVTGSFSFVRWLFTNCFHVGGGSGFAATVAGSDYNASDDTSAPGSNSLQNRTTADFANFAGGDYRTASASALATAGDTSIETYIGFALEAGGAGNSTIIDFSAKKPSLQALVENTQENNSLNVDFSIKKQTFNASIENSESVNTIEVDFTSSAPLFSLLIENEAQSNLSSVDFSAKKPQINANINNSTGINLTSINFSYKKSQFNTYIDNNPDSNLLSVDFSVRKPELLVEITNETNANQSIVDFSINSAIFTANIQNGQIVVKFNKETNYTQQALSKNYIAKYLSTNYTQG